MIGGEEASVACNGNSDVKDRSHFATQRRSIIVFP